MRNLMPFIQALQDLGDNTTVLIADVSALLQTYHISAREFQELDERPGHWGYDPDGDGREWHWKLRRWRNHPKARFHFDTSKRCRSCGTILQRNPDTNRLRCPAVGEHY